MAINASVIVHDEIVRAKLLAAAPRIIAQNRLLVDAILQSVSAATIMATPVGPGHFGYHGRDTVKVVITQGPLKTTGQLKAAVQLFWREYGTGTRFRAKGKSAALKQAVRVMTGAASGGEPAFMPANKALAAAKRFIGFYYNGMANWWRL